MEGPFLKKKIIFFFTAWKLASAWEEDTSMHVCVHAPAEEKTASEAVGMAEVDSKLLFGGV